MREFLLKFRTLKAEEKNSFFSLDSRALVLVELGANLKLELSSGPGWTWGKVFLLKFEVSTRVPGRLPRYLGGDAFVVLRPLSTELQGRPFSVLPLFRGEVLLNKAPNQWKWEPVRSTFESRCPGTSNSNLSPFATIRIVTKVTLFGVSPFARLLSQYQHWDPGEGNERETRFAPELSSLEKRERRESFNLALRELIFLRNSIITIPPPLILDGGISENRPGGTCAASMRGNTLLLVGEGSTERAVRWRTEVQKSPRPGPAPIRNFGLGCQLSPLPLEPPRDSGCLASRVKGGVSR